MTSNTYHFDGKIVIISGAARGIGRAMAHAFLDNGATVIACDLREELVKETVDDYENGHYAVVDVSNEQAVRDFVQSVAHDYGKIDVVINNAGIFTTCEIEEMPYETWHRLFAVNTDSLFFFAKYSLPYLKQTKGSLIATSSVSGLRGDWGQTAYNATKHAVSGFVRCTAMDYGKYGVRVNAVAPAFTQTDMNKSVWSEPNRLKPFLDRIPLARLGQSEDIANAAVFLASEDASYITGVILPVDGGTTAATGQGRGEYDE